MFMLFVSDEIVPASSKAPPPVTVEKGSASPRTRGRKYAQLVISLRVSPEHIVTENAVFCTAGLCHRMPQYVARKLRRRVRRFGSDSIYPVNFWGHRFSGVVEMTGKIVPPRNVQVNSIN